MAEGRRGRKEEERRRRRPRGAVVEVEGDESFASIEGE